MSNDYDLDAVRRFFGGDQKKRDLHWRCGGFAKTVIQDERFVEIISDLKQRFKDPAFSASASPAYREDLFRKYQAVCDIEQELKNMAHGYEALVFERQNENEED
ncbi:hypothetical protein VCHA36P166_50172 [Vibrio chagasii]|nr:hypothetical protein VCHA36P166_50172 [Vibrio chagasii]